MILGLMKYRSLIPVLLLPWIVSMPAGAVPADEKEGAPAAHRGKAYPGAFHFFRLPSATVVYPAGPGHDPAWNRRSAEARARYLEAAFGMRTRVLADVEAREEDLRENLLVLGWDNAVFGRDGVPPPAVRSTEGIVVLGFEHGDPTADALVFDRSPFDRERYLLFWSRIDPERDRFSVLPRVGSDWAVYDDFLPIAQGMCKPDRAWPPEREPLAEADHRPGLRATRQRERIRSTSRYDIHYDPEALSSEIVSSIAAARERAFASAAEAIGAPPETYRIALHLYADEATKKALTGVDDPAHAFPRKAELHMTARAARSASPHEEAHLLAGVALGSTVVTALYEGLAISVEDRVRGLPLEVAGAILHDGGGVPPLDALLDEERFRSMPESVGPVAAGLLASFIRAVAPAARLSEAYRIDRGDPRALAAALDLPPDAIEGRFREWVGARAKARAADVRFHRAEVEAQERYAAGDWRGMIVALERALEARPGDPQTLFNLASAQMRADALPDAEKVLRRILATEEERLDPRFRIFSHYQLGRVLDLMGRRDDALAEYRAVLALPDQNDAHRLARERVRSPATREHLD